MPDIRMRVEKPKKKSRFWSWCGWWIFLNILGAIIISALVLLAIALVQISVTVYERFGYNGLWIAGGVLLFLTITGIMAKSIDSENLNYGEHVTYPQDISAYYPKDHRWS